MFQPVSGIFDPEVYQELCGRMIQPQVHTLDIEVTAFIQVSVQFGLVCFIYKSRRCIASAKAIAPHCRENNIPA